MNLLLSTGSVHHLDPETAFWLGRYARFDGIELILDARVAEVGAAGIARFVEQYQIPVVNVHVPIEPLPDWGGYWENVRRSMTWARGLKARVLVLHPDPSLRGLGRREAIFARRLKGLRAAAAEQGLVVALENLPRPLNPLKRLADGLGRFRTVCDLARRTGVRITFDTAHLASWGAGVVPAFRRARALVANLHLSDYADGRQHLLPKHGSLPLNDLLTVVHQVGYTGPIVLEVCPEALEYGEADVVLAPLVRARKWMRRHAGR